MSMSWVSLIIYDASLYISVIAAVIGSYDDPPVPYRDCKFKEGEEDASEGEAGPGWGGAPCDSGYCGLLAIG